MAVPVINTSAVRLTLVQSGNSPLTPLQVTVSGARRAQDNRSYDLDPDTGGSDTAKLNELLKDHYGVMSSLHVRNSHEVVALLV